MPFLTEKVFLPSFSSGLAARWSSTVPAQTIGDTFWQLTCILASPFDADQTVRGPRIIRGTSCVFGTAGDVGVVGGVVGEVVGGVDPCTVAGWSLASITATPRLFVIVALTGSPRLTEKFSMNSGAPSSSTVTEMVFVFSPGANVREPTRAE